MAFTFTCSPVPSPVALAYIGVLQGGGGPAVGCKLFNLCPDQLTTKLAFGACSAAVAKAGTCFSTQLGTPFTRQRKSGFHSCRGRGPLQGSKCWAFRSRRWSELRVQLTKSWLHFLGIERNLNRKAVRFLASAVAWTRLERAARFVVATLDPQPSSRFAKPSPATGGHLCNLGVVLSGYCELARTRVTPLKDTVKSAGHCLHGCLSNCVAF